MKEAMMTIAEVDQHDNGSQINKVQQRLSLAVLTKSRAELEQMMTDNPDAVTTMLEMVMNTYANHQVVTELLEISEDRMISVVDAELVRVTGESGPS